MTAVLTPVPSPAVSSPRVLRRPGGWTLGLLAIGLLALVLTGWQVWAGAPSEYYASIALSMSRSWSNFFFGAVDPAGTVTLDKIPGSFWIPALFVRVFGYSAWAVILPNSLAAVGAALITAVTARRLAGVRAGLIAGAIVAVTPILVAVARSNQPEAFFVLGLSLTAYAAVRAVHERRAGWLVAAGALVGLSFQFYMLEAWAVWPALAAAYLFTRQSWGRRLGHLLVAGVVSLASSLWWVAIVALIPAGSRPYIGSTLSNDPWEMVFGYNGLGRFSATSDSSAYESFTPPFSGDPGLLRLFNAQLAGQVAWLIPAAIVAIVVLWVLRFPRPLTVLLTVWTATFVAMFSAVAGMHQFYTAALAVPLGLVVATALALAHRAERTWPQVAIVGTAGVTALGIGLASGGYSIPVSIAQAVAAAVAIALLLARRGSRMVTTALMLVGLLLTPAVWSAVTIAHPSSINPVAGGVSEMSGGGFGGGMPGGGRGSSGAGGGFAGGSAGQGGAAQGGAAQGGAAQGGAAQGGAAQGGAAQGGGAGGGAAPGGSAPGSGTAAGGGAQGGFGPGAGTGGSSTRDGAGRAAGGGGFGAGAGTADTALIAWLEQNAAGSTYLAATFGAQSAASLIVASDGGSFLPIGGFNGTDAVPTLDEFVSLVKAGDVRYVIEGQERGGGGFGSSATANASTSAQIRDWVGRNCAIDSSAPSTVYACS